MKSKLFHFENQPVAVVPAEDGEAWFCGIDVAFVLGYPNVLAALEINVDQNHKAAFRDDLCGAGELIYVNLRGVAALIAKSALNAADMFRVWVADVVLPALGPAPPKQIFYVATTHAYARQNRFKIGGVKSSRDLAPRLSSYNSGRAQNDLMFFVARHEVHSYRAIERRLLSLLDAFRDRLHKNAEMVHIHYEALASAIEFVFRHENEALEWMDARREKFAIDAACREPAVVTPLSVSKCKRSSGDRRLLCGKKK